jgi:hypothetical protein
LDSIEVVKILYPGALASYIQRRASHSSPDPYLGEVPSRLRVISISPPPKPQALAVDNVSNADTANPRLVDIGDLTTIKADVIDKVFSSDAEFKSFRMEILNTLPRFFCAVQLRTDG